MKGLRYQLMTTKIDFLITLGENVKMSRNSLQIRHTFVKIYVSLNKKIQLLHALHKYYFHYEIQFQLRKTAYSKN